MSFKKVFKPYSENIQQTIFLFVPASCFSVVVYDSELKNKCKYFIITTIVWTSEVII